MLNPAMESGHFQARFRDRTDAKKQDFVLIAGYRGINVILRAIAIFGIFVATLVVSGCTSCGKFEHFNAPNMPKLCHQDTAPN